MGSTVAKSVALVALILVASAATYARGVDVSNWQGSIDWLQVSGDGYTFAFAKATESTTYTDITYALNRSGTQAIGMRLGPYHFARPAGSGDAARTASAIAQADYFVDRAQPRAGDLPPVLDLETTGGLKPPNLVTWTEAWLGEVAARTGLSALIYSSPNFWRTALADTSAFALAGHRLWIAHWTKSAAPLVPAGNWGGNGWEFWQWSDCQKVPGITSKCVDADRVNGVDATPFALGAYPTGAPASATPPTVVGTPRAGAKLAAVPGTWSGGKPVAFSYQWQSCDSAGAGCAPIPGATLETYTPAAADIGHALVVSVTATARGTAAAAASSAPTVAVAAANGATVPAAIAPPQVSGTLQVGQTLTASVGTWSGSPTTFAWEWQRCDALGASCVPIAGATAATYTLTPGDAGATLSLLVTAKNGVGSQGAAAPTTGVVAAAPVPPAVTGSLVAQPGAAGAVVSDDAAATVTWQPGAVPDGTAVSLASSGGVLQLTLAPPARTLPWPVDLAYAAAPNDRIVGFSTDGRIWSAVAPLTAQTLPAGLLQGTYADGATLHVLTRKAGQFKLFTPNVWGDPRKVSRFAPRIRRIAPIRVKRLRSGVLVVSTRLTVPSQALIVPSHRRVLAPGSFPFKARVSARTRRLHITAIDPWGRRGGFTLSFRAP